MVLNLNIVEVPATESKVYYEGGGEFEVAAGQSLKIETSPAGEDLLDAEVPAGRKWNVSIRMHIDEVDA